MSEEQLAALLAKLKDDAGLQEKHKGAADLDAAVAIAKEAGFDVSKADWLRYQAQQTLELSDEELEGVAGGLCSAQFWRQAGERVRQVATRVVREVGFGTC
jgi:predicted ribosomally synthesized peptide with nif11-like leader